MRRTTRVPRLTKTLKKVADERKDPNLYMMVGFISGMVDKAPKYEVPDAVAVCFFKNE